MFNNEGERAYIVIRTREDAEKASAGLGISSKLAIRSIQTSAMTWAVDLRRFQKRDAGSHYKIAGSRKTGWNNSLIVTFSAMPTQQGIREQQIERAQKKVAQPSAWSGRRPTTPAVLSNAWPSPGWRWPRRISTIWMREAIAKEARFDRFYRGLHQSGGRPAEHPGGESGSLGNRGVFPHC